jgi:hypothetical protein
MHHTAIQSSPAGRVALEKQALDSSLLSITYHGILWKSLTVEGHRRIASGTEFNSITLYLRHFSGYPILDMPDSYTTGGLSVDRLFIITITICSYADLAKRHAVLLSVIAKETLPKAG